MTKFKQEKETTHDSCMNNKPRNIFLTTSGRQVSGIFLLQASDRDFFGIVSPEPVESQTS